MNIKNDFSLKDILWYRIGGKAKYLLDIAGRDDLEQAIKFLEEHDLYKNKKYIVTGLGSNLVFKDDYFDGAVIRFVPSKDKKRSFVVEKYNKLLVTAYAGETLDDLILFSFQKGLIGLEWAGGLPGTVGAAVRGNVGAFGKEIKDSFCEAEILKLRNGGRYIFINGFINKKMNFSYRQSIVKQEKHMLILYATFLLQKATPEQLKRAKEVYEANISYRKLHHPLEYPNCGSVFKNIKQKEEVAKVLEVWPDVAEMVTTKWYGKVSMGYIIHRLGFAGFKLGNAQVSEKHNNFIVNLGEAKSKDVLAIINMIQKKVQETFGFMPEVEVEVVK